LSDTQGDAPPQALAATPAVAAPAPSPDSGARPRLRRDVAIAAIAGIGAAIALFAIYLAIVVPGSWLARIPAREWPATALKVASGAARMDGATLVVTTPGSSDTTLVSLDADFRSSDYLGIEWVVSGVPENADVRLLWRSDVLPRRTNLAAGVAEAGGVRTFVLARDPAWIGRIEGLALAIRSPLAGPLRIERVVAHPLGASDYVRARVGEWLAFEPFNGATINTIAGGADSQDLPLPAFAAASVALAALALFLLGRYAPRAYRLGIGCTIAGLFAVAWLALDARWAFDLARQARVTWAMYAGKTPDERHRAAEDHDLYAFIQRAKALMPPPPARVFVAAGEHYFRGRAAYHLYPYNVEFEAFRDAVAPPSWMKRGDWLVVYHRRDIQYDAARKLLRWDGNPPVSAELKLLEANGAALFEIE
jgi:hypothetical protein